MNEVTDGRFWNISEIADQLGKDIFTPNFELDFKHFLNSGIDNLLEKYK